MTCPPPCAAPRRPAILATHTRRAPSCVHSATPPPHNQVGDEGMSLEALADAIQVDPSDIVRTLFMKGIMLSLNQVGGTRV